MPTRLQRKAEAMSGPGASRRIRAVPEQPCLARRAAALLALALASDDAEATGLRAAEVLADPDLAVAVLGSPDAWLGARHAVIQRYGRVGALMVLAYEERWRRRHTAGAPQEAAFPPACAPSLEDLVDLFDQLDADEVDGLLADLERAEGLAADEEVAAAHRWLHATYAVAARDQTDAAHHAYMAAFDRVMRLARPRLAS